jgi:hypothetical protein
MISPGLVKLPRMSDTTTVPFTEEAVKQYLDDAIRLWREYKTQVTTIAATNKADHYIDAYQSVRTSLFGELLP